MLSGQCRRQSYRAQAIWVSFSASLCRHGVCRLESSDLHSETHMCCAVPLACTSSCAIGRKRPPPESVVGLLLFGWREPRAQEPSRPLEVSERGCELMTRE